MNVLSNAQCVHLGKGIGLLACVQERKKKTSERLHARTKAVLNCLFPVHIQ